MKALQKMSDNEKLELYQLAFKKRSRRITGDNDYEWAVTPEVDEHLADLFLRHLQPEN